MAPRRRVMNPSSSSNRGRPNDNANNSRTGFSYAEGRSRIKKGPRTLTERRKEMVFKFMEKHVANKNRYGEIGSLEWNKGLVKFMAEHPSRKLTVADVKRWLTSDMGFFIVAHKAAVNKLAKRKTPTRTRKSSEPEPSTSGTAKLGSRNRSVPRSDPSMEEDEESSSDSEDNDTSGGRGATGPDADPPTEEEEDSSDSEDKTSGSRSKGGKGAGSKQASDSDESDNKGTNTEESDDDDSDNDINPVAGPPGR